MTEESLSDFWRYIARHRPEVFDPLRLVIQRFIDETEPIVREHRRHRHAQRAFEKRASASRPTTSTPPRCWRCRRGSTPTRCA